MKLAMTRIDAINAAQLLPGRKQPGAKASSPAAKAEGSDKSMPPKLSRDERINIAKNRIHSGYYNSSAVNEAISDRISGVFDRLA